MPVSSECNTELFSKFSFTTLSNQPNASLAFPVKLTNVPCDILSEKQTGAEGYANNGVRHQLWC